MCVCDFLFLTQFIQGPLNLESATSIKTLIIKSIFSLLLLFTVKEMERGAPIRGRWRQ